MDFRDIMQNIKDFFSSLWQKTVDFVRENTMLSACIGALVCVIFIAIILLCSALKKPKDKSYERPLTLTEEMLVSPSPVLPDGYNASRITKEQWTNEEAEDWFTKPGQKELDDLSRANDRIIQEITGAAP